MTKEMDIVVRKNEENLKISKNLDDTMKMLIMGKNETIQPIASLNEEDEIQQTATLTELQRFYSGKNVFITGGTGKLLLFIFRVFVIAWRMSYGICARKKLNYARIIFNTPSSLRITRFMMISEK